jgi:hypothetical protein
MDAPRLAVDFLRACKCAAREDSKIEAAAGVACGLISDDVDPLRANAVGELLACRIVGRMRPQRTIAVEWCNGEVDRAREVFDGKGGVFAYICRPQGIGGIRKEQQAPKRKLGDCGCWGFR